MKYILDIENEKKANEISETLRNAGHTEVADQIKVAVSNMDLGPKLSTLRHANKKGAELVANVMATLTNAKVFADHSPIDEKDKNRGIGEWAIFYHSGRGQSSLSSHRMSSCATAAEMLVLADALRKHEPNHPLLETWHLRLENRKNLPRYYV